MVPISGLALRGGARCLFPRIACLGNLGFPMFGDDLSHLKCELSRRLWWEKFPRTRDEFPSARFILHLVPFDAIYESDLIFSGSIA